MKNILNMHIFVGLSNKRLKRYEDALDSFYKLHSILRNSAQVIYQIADLYPFLVFVLFCWLVIAYKITIAQRTEWLKIQQWSLPWPGVKNVNSKINISNVVDV